jgi:hypothetical protein
MDPENSSLTAEDLSKRVAEREKWLEQTKAAHLKRVTSSECLKLIQKATPSEAGDVVEAITQEYGKKAVYYVIPMTSSSISIALTAGSFVFSGPVWGTASPIAGLAAALLTLPLAIEGLTKQFDQTSVGVYDKLWVCLSTADAAISVPLVILFSEGIAPIVTATSFGVAWLGINVATLYRLHQLETSK